MGVPHAPDRLTTFRARLVVVAGLAVASFAVAILIASNVRPDHRTAEAASGPGLNLVCDDVTPLFSTVTCQIQTNNTPSAGGITGFGAEITGFENFLSLALSGNCASNVKAGVDADGDGPPLNPPAQCTRNTPDTAPPVGPDRLRYVIVSDTDPGDGVNNLLRPNGTQFPDNTSGIPLVNFALTCNVQGQHTLVLTTTSLGFGSQTSPFGGFYGLPDLSTVPTKAPDKEVVQCQGIVEPTVAPTELKNVSANLSATKALAGQQVTVSGTANFRQDMDGDTVAGWLSGTISVATTAGAVKQGTISSTFAVCVPAPTGGTCTANMNLGPASPPTPPESSSNIVYSNTINCTNVGTHDVTVNVSFIRENGTAVPANKSTNNTVTRQLTCNPLTPPIEKLPPLSNLFLTNQPGPKLPPVNCQTGTDDAILQEVVGLPIATLDPKGSGQEQQLAAFEFEVRYDEKLVCVNLEPGPAWVAAGASCLIFDKDVDQTAGISLMTCFTDKGSAPGDAGLHLANIIIKPQPELYSMIRPNQENGAVAQVLNQNCNLADAIGHGIPFFSCEDADVTIRYLEGDVDANCEVDVRDGQALAFRWNAELGNLLYNAFYDLMPSVDGSGLPLNGDGKISVKDIQFVFGRMGSTCDVPNPSQPPVNGKLDP
jgi:hypothetical protein